MDVIANKYTIIREIARSNDVVYEATDETMGRHLAIKVLTIPPNLTGQPLRERIERFNREARATGRLSHPNIVTVYAYGEDNGKYFIAMEFLEGSTLRDVMQARGSFPLDEAINIGTQALSALTHAHTHKVIHRDIKPENIHLLPGNHVKLTDFGIARLTEEASLTGEGQVFGTPSYMSPEQIEGHYVDHRSDIFSLGVVLYEMLAGRKPFTGDSVVSITYNIMHADPPPLSGVPYGVSRVVMRALSRDPSQRYNNAQEMIAALKTADRSMAIPSIPPLPGTGYYGGTPFNDPFSGAGLAGPSQSGLISSPSQGIPSSSYLTGQQSQLSQYGQSNALISGRVPSTPPPVLLRHSSAPRKLSRGARTMLLVIFWSCLISGVILGFVVLFMRAYDTQHNQATSHIMRGLINQGVSSYNEGNYPEAVQKLDKAYKMDPERWEGREARKDLAKAWNIIGVQEFQQNRLPQAAAAWNNTLELYSRAVSLSDEEQILRQAAVNNLKSIPTGVSAPSPIGGYGVSRAAPNSANPDANMSERLALARKELLGGYACRDTGDNVGAKQHFSQVITLAPGSNDAINAQEELSKIQDNALNYR